LSAQSQILIVDQSRLLREFYAQVLGDSGFVAICSDDCKDAKSLLADGRYHFAVALVDFLQAPDQHLKLIEAIRKMPTRKSLPIISIIDPATENTKLLRIARSSDSLIVRGDFELPRLYHFIRQFMPPAELAANGKPLLS
jgi:DNA-binding response OmpR family regulator